MDAVFAFLIGTAITIAGWLILHQLNRQRDRESRKYAADAARLERRNRFFSFIGRWRSEVERADESNQWASYSGKIHEFRAEARMIRDDFDAAMLPEFDKLVGYLGCLTAPEAGRMGPHDAKGKVIAARIDLLANFVERN